MSVTEAWGLYAANIAGSIISGVQEQSMDPGIDRRFITADGEVYREWSAIFDQRAVMGFSTSELVKALSVVGSTGLKAEAATPAIFFLKQRDKGGIFKSGANHQKKTITEGITVPRTLQATHGQDPARLSYETFATFDGTNAPVIIANSQALIGSPAVTLGYGPGPLTINGTLIDGVQDINVDWGIQLLVLGGDGNAYPTWVSIQEVNTVARITVLEASLEATLGISGVPQSGTTKFYFRKKLTGSTDVPDATTEHIEFLQTEGSISLGQESTTGTGETTVEIIIEPTWDKVNLPFIIDTATAID